MRSAATGKRMHSGGDSGDSGGIHTDVQNDGFTEFKSRYTKRRCRRDAQQSDPSDQNQSGGEQTPQHSQPSRRGGSRNRGGSRGRVGHQSRGHVVGSSSVNNNNNKPAKPAGKSVVTTEAIDAAIDSVISQSQLSQQIPSHSQSISMKDFHALTTQVHTLKKQVADLKQQVESLLSIASANGPILVENTVNNLSADGSQSYAAAASRQLSAPLREAVLTAVHSDLRVKQSRTCNVVVSGLPFHDELTDDEFFGELCDTEFSFKPDIVRTARLGDESSGRLQPLLVVLRSELDAKDLLALAKTLRKSEDVYTSTSVYIAPHQTRAERQAAYEARCRRRQQVSAQQPNSPAERARPQPRARTTAATGNATRNNHSTSIGALQAGRSTTTNTSHNSTSALRLTGNNKPATAAAAADFDTDFDDEDLMNVGDSDGGVCDGVVTRALSQLRQSAAEFKPAAPIAAAVAPVDVLSGSSGAPTGAVASPSK